MFGDEALRLLRTKWASASELAEELYAIFRAVDSLPTDLQGPVTITNPGSQPALSTLGTDGGSGNIVVRNPDGTPSITIGGDDISLGGSDLSTLIQQGGGGGGSSDANLVFPGSVVSGGPGPGPYQVKIFPNGPAFAGTTVPVTQLQIASDASLPAGTSVLVVKTKSGYQMQAPVWLAPAT